MPKGFPLPATRRHYSTLRQVVLSDDGSRTLRQRQHGGRALPLPPLMDPIAQAAKSRHTSPKAAKAQEKTALQTQLEHNPFAQALATPVRQCALTHARLPSHFLLPFVSTLPAPSPASETLGAPKATLHPDLGSLLTHPHHLLRSPARSYVAARKSIIDVLTKKKWWRQLASMRVREWFAKKVGRSERGLVVGKEWVWDEGMGGVVEERLREGVREALESMKGKLRWVDIKREDDMEGVDGAAFVLFYGGDITTGDGVDKLESQDDGDDNALCRIRRTIPKAIRLYDLSQLFPHADQELETILGRFNPDDSTTTDGPAVCIVPTGAKDILQLELAILRLESYIRNRASIGTT